MQNKYIPTQKHKDSIAKSLTGRKLSVEHIQNLRKGIILAYSLGKGHRKKLPIHKCLECQKELTDRRNIRCRNCSTKVKSRYDSLRGDKNKFWKGDKVGYVALHNWVKRRKFKTNECEFCGLCRERVALANISNEYKRDITDWKYLCIPCHTTYDIRYGKPHRYKEYLKGVRLKYKRATK